MSFEGSVAIVTGAGGEGGIGEAIALKLARSGASVAVVDICHDDPEAPRRKLASWDELQAVAERVNAAGGTGLAIKADLTDEDAVADMIRQVETQFGALNLLFNNAAGGRSAGPINHTPVTQLSRSDWDFTLAASLTSVFLCCKWAAPLIARSGGGAIVNTNTMSAHYGVRGMSAYLSAKYALVEFTKILALELAPDNIRVNAFSPGMTLTPSLRFRYEEIAAEKPEHSAEEHMKLRTVDIPLGRMADPEEMASVACFLASKEASYMIGQTLEVDGGRRV
ncbi:SDR family NAD(P)-dependent oxidoreductase [Sphingosinicella xenopeptidilytica]|uniref:SDR family NAD(P)-dependent oxidoreductase n=1 Tax=Sphingosinicella xenopeptidilytica TaxID=364098 RepID=A0ABW3C3C4_SPHXN